MKINHLKITFISILAPLVFLYFSNYEKKLTVSTALLFFFLIFFRKYFFENEKVFMKKIITYNLKIFYFILILFFLIITQNKYLNVETITWDVSSYLVASNEIDLGNIPLESQWESKGPLTNQWIEKNDTKMKHPNKLI
jgi:hypothetical protein